MKEMIAGVVLWLIAALQFSYWNTAKQQGKRKDARNHIIAAVLLGIAGLILMFGRQSS